MSGRLTDDEVKAIIDRTCGYGDTDKRLALEVWERRAVEREVRLCQRHLDIVREHSTPREEGE